MQSHRTQTRIVVRPRHVRNLGASLTYVFCLQACADPSLSGHDLFPGGGGEPPLHESLWDAKATVSIGCDENERQLIAEIFTDNYAWEMSVQLVELDSEQKKIAGPPEGHNYERDTRYKGWACLAKDKAYKFTVFDEPYKDGIYDPELGSNGGVKLVVDGTEVWAIGRYADRPVAEQFAQKSYTISASERAGGDPGGGSGGSGGSNGSGSGGNSNTLLGTSAIPGDQYTPEQADWSAWSDISTIDHGAFNPIYTYAEWDGSTYSTGSSSFIDDLCPKASDADDKPVGPRTVRGLKELYAQAQPFRNSSRPTRAEVDKWNSMVMNRIRELAGVGAIARDQCLFARALWASERKYTGTWDLDVYADPPGNMSSKVWGPCDSSNPGHCGEGFVPNAQHQRSYLLKGTPTCHGPGGGAGILPVNYGDGLRWAHVLSRAFCGTLELEGYSGHIPAFFKKRRFGVDFVKHTNKKGSKMIHVRFKWGD